MPLPILTTMDDVREIVSYLRTRPVGATAAEARAVVRPQVLDGRKIAAYLGWAIIERDGERLKLAPRGWELARKPQEEAQTLRAILDGIIPYRSVLEWAHHQKMVSITNVDVAAHWAQHHSAAVGTENENTIKDAAVCFFHLAQGAGLGKLTIGRHSKATRLDLDREQLRRYVEAGPSAPPWMDSGAAPQTATDISTPPALSGHAEPAAPPAQTPAVTAEPKGGRLRVFISHGKDKEIVEQVQALLTLAQMDTADAEAEETTA